MKNSKVMIFVGSVNDVPTMEDATKTLSEFGVDFELHVASAHRTPDKVAKLADEASGRGIKVMIAAAGYAAHLAGAVAARTILPVIGVPIDASSLGGIDALLSTAQMPAGIPVATVAIGKAGAKNAALLACEILALSDSDLAEKLTQSRLEMASKVEEADSRIKR